MSEKKLKHTRYGHMHKPVQERHKTNLIDMVVVSVEWNCIMQSEVSNILTPTYDVAKISRTLIRTKFSHTTNKLQYETYW